jgi:hypothetical protein
MGIRSREEPFRIVADSTMPITLKDTDQLIVIGEE